MRAISILSAHNNIVSVLLDTNEVKLIDLSHIIASDPKFINLKNEEIFQQVIIEDYGTTLEWPDAVAIDVTQWVDK